MQKRANKQVYESFFAPLPVQREELIYCDKRSITLPYAEDFPKLHYHDRFEIGICERGEGLFLSEGEFYAVFQGDVIFIAPGRRHYSRSLFENDTCKCRFAYLDAENIYRLLCFSDEEKNQIESLCQRIPSVIPVSSVPCAEELSCALGLCANYTQSLGRIVALKLCSFILRAQNELSLRGNVPKKVSYESNIEKAAEYIALHYMETFHSKELARMCHLSESQLRRSFTDVYGIPPIAYKNRLRCLVASELLHKSRMTAQQIAVKVGYTSTSDFYRAFKKFSGASPSEYRKEIQNGNV